MTLESILGTCYTAMQLQHTPYLIVSSTPPEARNRPQLATERTEPVWLLSENLGVNPWEFE